MDRRVTLTPRVRVAVRLLAGVALSLFAVGLAVHTQGLIPPLTPTQSRVGPAAPQLAVQADDVGDFYLYQGRRIPLHRSQDALGVRFRATLARESTAPTLQSLVPAASIQRAGDPGTQGVSIVVVPPQTAADGTTRLDAGAPQQRLDQARETLKASPTVEFVFPVFINPGTGTRLLVTDEVVAKLRNGVAPSAVAARFAVTVVGPLARTADEYVFRLVDPKRADPLTVANAIAASDLVEWAEPNFIQEYQKSAVPNDPLFPNQWHLNNTGQGGGTSGADAHLPGAWDLTTGSASIVIAIIDDGVERTHEDLAANIFTNPGEIAGNGIDDDGNGYIDDVNGWDFSNNDNNPSPMSVDDDHGTAVAGVAAGRGNNGVGVSGACQTCRILPVKIFSPSFAGDTAAANAIRYAASLADVLNNSWGGGTPSSTLQSAIQWATTNGRDGKGSVVLFASGNSAGALWTFSLTGVPAGTHHFRWRYAKNSSVSSGDDTAWLAGVQLPGGERINFESGIPADWTTGGNANWSVVLDQAHADEGFCQTHAAKAGTITDSQSTYLGVVRTVPAGTLRFTAWVSSESNYDKLWLDYDGGNDGTWSSFFGVSGVTAATNDVSYPAAYPESIAVGASSDFDCRSNYSQYGTALAFVAPSSGGNSGITTTDRTGSAGYDASNYTSTFGGTSSATPLSSGIAGLLLSRNASLTIAQVRQTLQDTADKVGPEPYTSGRNNRYGYGRINAAAALVLCVYSVTPTSTVVPAGGGSGSVSVTANAVCGWTATSNDAWITVTSGSSGTSTGSVGYSVAANAGSPRTGTVTIAGRTFTVNQAGPGCSCTLTPTSTNVAGGSVSGTVSVTAGAGCPWTAVSNDEWITVTSGASGNGNGTVGYWVTTNTGAPRTGTITIGWQPFTVNQATAQFTDISAALQGLDESAVAWGDYDSDGDLDALVTGCSMNYFGTGCYTLNSKLYRNEGGGVFTNVSVSLTDIGGGSVAWGDYDRDGRLDIALSGCEVRLTSGCYRSVTKIYRNLGSSFSDSGASLPAASSAVAWGDYDNDGDLDLLAGARLYRNSGGVFTEVMAGLPTMTGAVGAWGDYDNDGDLDVLLVGDTGAAYLARVYRNDGDGVFTDLAAGLTGVSALASGSAAWGDYDNDGDLDILVSGSTGSASVTKLYRNDGGGAFTDTGAGLAGVSGSVAWGDYDNDGDLDILVSGSTGPAYVTKLYRNDGGGVFVEAGETLSAGRVGVAWGDYDNDGDLDILISGNLTTRIFRNGGSTFNAVPSAPTGLVAAPIAGQVTLGWAASTDAQTPAAGLTYNVRMATTAGGVNVVSPMASPTTGYRRVVRLGNTGPRRSAVLGQLPEGTYYWSVQALDTAFAGSSFASEGTFTVYQNAFVTDVASLSVAEGGTNTFRVKLNALPVSTVTATVARVSGDTDITVTSGASLTFTTATWNTYQSITLGAAEDVDAVNGTATIRVSATGLADRDVTATETDNDPAFTDDPLTARGTLVKAVHITELRNAIAALRTRFGLDAFSWTDPALVAGATPVKAAHLTDLRAALNAVYVAAGRTLPAYTDPAVTATVTVIKTVHIAELRAAVLAVW